ncbi:MAG TPA: efflux RND transporter periplasmic adaptor subunit [Caulobacteraceae bacterium]|nr:efflux RND transporter periplasmic adaptor subunit [Caulobacteraceae bacterium]
MTLKRGLLLGGVGVVVLTAVAGVGMAAFQKPTPPQYLTEQVALGDVEKAVLATGSLQPYEVINVGSQTNGQVLAVNVKLGDHVTPGQVLAQIDPAQLENQLRNAQTRLAERKAQVGMVQANLAMNQANVIRQTKLRQAGVGSDAQFEQAQAQMKNNQANVQQFENQVKTAETEVELAKINLDKATIRAPIDGIVAEIVARQGMTVNTNRDTPTIVKLAKMDVMSVRAQVSEADITKVQPGQKVYFTLLGDPEKRYYATLRMREVTPAGGVLDPNGTGPPKGAIYYNALFEVPNKNGELLPAMTAEVHVVLGEAKHVLTVPLTALGDKDASGRYLVRVIGPDGNPQDRRVLTGLANSSVAEVKDGLRVGERVVIGEASNTKAKAKSPLFSGLSAPKL